VGKIFKIFGEGETSRVGPERKILTVHKTVGSGKGGAESPGKKDTETTRKKKEEKL